MTTYFITRHLGALAWAKQQGVHYDVHLQHLFSLNKLQAGDRVIGTLPINMVFKLNQLGVSYVHLSLNIPPHLRGIELSAEQLNECEALLEEFLVSKPSYIDYLARLAGSYFACFLRISETCSPPKPQLSVFTWSIITKVLAGFLLRTFSSSWVTPLISSAFCSLVMGSSAIFMFTKGMV